MKKKIFHLLCNEYTGGLISALFGNSIPNCRYGFRRFKTPAGYCNNTVKAMIFWGFYESAEMRLIPKYIKSDLPVVELGASLGIVSTVTIFSLDNNTSYTCIEANPYLIDCINSNLKKFHPGRTNLNVENKAIAYTTEDSVEMMITKNNTQGRISYDVSESKEAVKVTATTLQPYSNVPYVLICDIEGMEIEIISHDKQSLQNCRQLFIELHKAWYLTDIFEVHELETFITGLGFQLVERDGNVFYFINSSLD